jgi:hypothetical protein
MTSSSSANIKRISPAIVAVLAIFLVYQLNRDEALVSSEQELQPTLNEWPHMSADPTLNPLLAKANSELVSAQRALASAVKAAPDLAAANINQPALKLPSAWRIPEATAATPSMPLPAGVSVYEPVAIDMESPVYPEVGQQIAVTMPGGELLQVNIENSVTNPNGDYTWRGHLDGFGDEYPVVMTYGGNSVFATVTTPKGSYTLESLNGSGWIYKNPSEFELSDPGANDYLEIPLDH